MSLNSDPSLDTSSQIILIEKESSLLPHIKPTKKCISFTKFLLSVSSLILILFETLQFLSFSSSPSLPSKGNSQITSNLQTSTRTPVTEFTAVYDVKNAGGITKIFDYIQSRLIDVCEEMEIDGEIKNASDTYKFETTGRHEITYRLNATLKSMELMFGHCSDLIEVDFSKLDTSNVKSMAHMFFKCSSLTSINFGDIDTSHVTKMEGLFNRCSSLATVDLSLFDTSLVTSFGSMFFGCSSLTSLDLSKWDTSSLEFMTYMFNGCMSLKEIDISGFSTEKVTFMVDIFKNISASGTITYPADMKQRIIDKIPEGWTKNEA